MLSAIKEFWNNLQRKKYLKNIDAFRQSYEAASDKVKRLLTPPPTQAEANALSLSELAALDKDIVSPRDFELLAKEVQMKEAETGEGTRTSFKVTTGPKNILYLEMYCRRSEANKRSRIINLYADLFQMYGDLSHSDALDVKFCASRNTFQPDTQHVTPGYIGGLFMLDEEHRHFSNYIARYKGQGEAEALELLHTAVRRSQKQKTRDGITSRLIGECIVFGLFPDPRT